MQRFYTKARNNKSGSALIGVLCIMCVFTALALSMLFASYQVLHHSQQIMTKEQCHVLAVTFSQQLDNEIIKTGDQDGIRKYIKDTMTKDNGNDWLYFAEDESGHAKKDVIKNVSAKMNSDTETKAGNLNIGMYWKKIQSSEAYDNRLLVVEVTAKLRGEQYRITNEYRLSNGSSSPESTWNWYNVDSGKSGGGS